MLELLQELIYHKGYANAALLRAIAQHEQAAQDAELRQLLHHIILANRFWVWLIRGAPFAMEEEAKPPASLADIKALYRDTHEREVEWLSQVEPTELNRTLVSTFIPGQKCSVAQAMLQVCLHSHGHRAQCATRLRSLHGTPPSADYILWQQERPLPDWE